MIDVRPLKPLHLGAEVVRRLLPHRPPLLLIDRIDRFSSDPIIVETSKLISSSDPVFSGHFPDLWLWPGAYTIEGLAQTCALAGALVLADAELAAAGRSVTGVLTSLQRGLVAGFTAELGEGDAKVLQRAATAGTGLLAAVDVKLTRPVFAGEILTFLAARTHVVGPMMRFDVEAAVEGKVAASGTITVATRSAP